MEEEVVKRKAMKKQYKTGKCEESYFPNMNRWNTEGEFKYNQLIYNKKKWMKK